MAAPGSWRAHCVRVSLPSRGNCAVPCPYLSRLPACVGLVKGTVAMCPSSCWLDRMEPLSLPVRADAAFPLPTLHTALVRGRPHRDLRRKMAVHAEAGKGQRQQGVCMRSRNGLRRYL